MGTVESQVEEEFLAALLKGSELMSAGKMADARPHLERAHQLKPKNEKAQNLLGLAYFKLGLYPQASAVYEALVLENPVDPTLRVNLGLVYLKANELDRCIKEFETATDLDPDHKKAHNYLGLALAQKGQYAQAKHHFVLAGSDAMADKMEKALAAAAKPAPAPAPAPPPPPPPAPLPPPPAPAAVAAPVPASPKPDEGIEVMHAESGDSVEEVAGELPAASLGSDWGDQLGNAPPAEAAGHGAEEPPTASEPQADAPPAPITVRLGGDPEPPMIDATVDAGEQLPVVEATVEPAVEEALDVTWTEPSRTAPVAEPPSPDQAWVVSTPTVVVEDTALQASVTDSVPPEVTEQSTPKLSSASGAFASTASGSYSASSSSVLRQPTEAEEQDWGGVADEVTVPVSSPVAEPLPEQHAAPAPAPEPEPVAESGTWEGEGVSSPSSVQPAEEAGWAGEGVPPVSAEEPWTEPVASLPMASSGSASWSDSEVASAPTEPVDAQPAWNETQPAQEAWATDAADGSGAWSSRDSGTEPLPGRVSQPAEAPAYEQPAESAHVARPEAQPSWEHSHDSRADAQWDPEPAAAPQPVPSSPGWVAQPLSEVSLSAGATESATDTGPMPQDTVVDSPPPVSSRSSSMTIGAPAPAPLISGSSVISATPSTEGAAPTGYAVMAAQRLVELGASQAWEPSSDEGPFHQGKDGLAVTVRGELLSRLVGLVAIVGGLEAKPETKKQRGRATEQPFGQGPSQLQRVTGHGVLYLEGGPGFQAIDLSDDDGTYLREERVFAFEEPLAFENGRLTAAGGLTLDLVNLKGQGRVLLSLDGSLKVMPVPAGSPMVVPLARVVGWFGRVTPRLMGFAGQGAVELTGDGHVLLGAPS